MRGLGCAPPPLMLYPFWLASWGKRVSLTNTAVELRTKTPVAVVPTTTTPEETTATPTAAAAGMNSLFSPLKGQAPTAAAGGAAAARLAGSPPSHSSLSSCLFSSAIDSPLEVGTPLASPSSSFPPALQKEKEKEAEVAASVFDADSYLDRPYSLSLSPSSSSNSSAASVAASVIQTCNDTEKGSRQQQPHSQHHARHASKPPLVATGPQPQHSSGEATGVSTSTFRTHYWTASENKDSELQQAEEDANDEQGEQEAEMLTFDAKFLQRLVEERLHDFSEKIHHDMTNLHLELIRQSQLQQRAVQQLMKQNEKAQRQLLQEVQVLREENKRLRELYGADP
ncbi:hypothetical protein QOT17_024350 [Balamuthia mandrillaris]